MGVNNAGLPNQPDKVLTPATPVQVPTRLTSGSGTFVPKPGTKWLRVTLLGGGAGGNANVSSACTGGLAAIPVTYWVKNTKTGYVYAVGAAGTGLANQAGLAGGNTTFDALTAYGALGPNQTPYQLGHSMGQNSPYGQGGGWASGAGHASGYGAGGAGSAPSGTGGNGSGGLIIVEEY